jgi:DNA-binding transcriptional ArsR family regulator
MMGSNQALKGDRETADVDSVAATASGDGPDTDADAGVSMGGPDDDGDDGNLSREEVFEVLSNGRRRCIVHYLKQHRDQRVELRDLVDYVAAWENDTTVEAVSGADRKSVYAAVKQTHLPKLDDANVVEYDRRSGEIELTDDAHEVEVYLEYEPRDDIAWGEYYLGLSAVGLTLVVIGWLNVPPFDALSPLLIALFLAVALAGSAAAHVYVSSQQRLRAEEFDLD